MCQLVGEWTQGVMAGAIFVCPGMPLDQQVYSYELSTEDRVCADLMLEDPYQQRCVQVGPSRIVGAGEGLFVSPCNGRADHGLTMC